MCGHITLTSLKDIIAINMDSIIEYNRNSCKLCIVHFCHWLSTQTAKSDYSKANLTNKYNYSNSGLRTKFTVWMLATVKVSVKT